MKMFQKSLLALMLAGALCGLTCCTLPEGGTDADSLVSDTVTAEEWAAVFHEESELYKNCKMILTASGAQKNPDGTTATLKRTRISVAEGNKLYSKTEYVTSGELSEEDEAFYAAQSGERYAEWVEYDGRVLGYYEYTQEDGVWKGKEVLHHGHCDYEIYHEITSLINGVEQFENWEYSEEAKGYVIKNIEDEGIKAMILKFKDGKLAAVIQDTEESWEDSQIQTHQTMTFTYGGQTVTLPTVEEPTPPTVGKPDAE